MELFPAVDAEPYYVGARLVQDEERQQDEYTLDEHREARQTTVGEKLFSHSHHLLNYHIEAAMFALGRREGRVSIFRAG